VAIEGPDGALLDTGSGLISCRLAELSRAKSMNGWMDGVIKDPNLAPNHSFRHYLKSELLARDVPERISDAITGHKTPGIGRKYEHVSMSKKFDAISKLPVTLPAA
jgi:integrase